MNSPLRSQPDYLENPHNGSDPKTWLKYSATTVDTSIQPDEDAFFADLVNTVDHKGSLKTAFDSMFTVEGNYSEGGDSPGILPLCRRDFDDNGSTRMNQDLSSRTEGLGGEELPSSTGGIGAETVSHFAAGGFDDLAKDISNAVDQTQQASQKLQQIQQQPATPAVNPAQPQPPAVPGAAPTPGAQPAPTPTTTPAPAPTTPAPAPSGTLKAPQFTPPPMGSGTTAPPVGTVPKPTPQPAPPPGPKPTSVTYSTKTSSMEFNPDAYSSKSMSERAHTAWFQSNPFMQFNQSSPLNPEGQYNDMNYNPRPSYFEEGTGDSSFANLHNQNNGNYSRDSLNFGGVSDMLVVRPADPRWTSEPPNLIEMLPISARAVQDINSEGVNGVAEEPSQEWLGLKINGRAASLSFKLDGMMMKQADLMKDNPYIRDYSGVAPLNGELDFSVNKPEKDPNDANNPADVGDSMHRQPNPRYRSMGGGGDAGAGDGSVLGAQFDPNQSNQDPFIETVAPASADGHNYSMPSYKTRRPVSDLPTGDFLKDH